MTEEPERRQTAAQPVEPQPEPTSDAIVPYGARLDQIAQDRFNRTDWIELAAAVLLALATIVAAWSAYQATRWGGVQANSFSAAGAARTEATQQTSIFAAGVQIDAMVWISYLEQRQAGDLEGAAFLEERFRPEFIPAFDAWLAQVPEGQIPPGTPFDMAQYRPQSKVLGDALDEQADELSATARDANQTSDNFVLVAVIMASVLFFAGVGTKLKARGVRLAMLLFAIVLFLGGVTFMLSMPQNVGL